MTYLLLVIAAVVLIPAEALARSRRHDPIDLRDGWLSASVGTISYGVGLLSQFAFTLLAASLLAHVAPWHLSARDPLVWLVFFLVDDFVNYWVHVATHKVPFLWAAHVVHHSTEDLSFVSAVRLSPVEGLYQPLLVLWAPLLGFPMAVYGPMLALALVIGGLSHTRFARPHPWLDRWLVTPSNHRVHHGTNPQYIDRNFGSSLVIWDRLFGTYEPEREAPRFGATETLPPTVLGTALGGYPKWLRERHAGGRPARRPLETSAA